jgi:hypothetical protein
VLQELRRLDQAMGRRVQQRRRNTHEPPGTNAAEQLQAGMLLDASGLQPSAKGWRIKYSGD